MSQKLITEVHIERQLINGLEIKSQMLKPINMSIPGRHEPRMVNSMEIVTALQRLGLARMWYGKVLHYLGEAYPYNETQASAADIKPLNDAASGVTGWLEEESHVKRVSDMRVSIQKRIDQVDYLRTKRFAPHESPEIVKPGREESISWTLVWQYLSEAKMYFGNELARVKEEEQKRHE